MAKTEKTKKTRIKKDPLIVIDLKVDKLRFPDRVDLVKQIASYIDYCRRARKVLPLYITLSNEQIENARESALSRKKEKAAPGVSFSYDGSPLIARPSLVNTGV